ncbi:MAG: acyl-ACP--UDP-N-acetylglucosamine O-acyltransferase [Pseudanabaenaceae cyanobacterium]
MVVSHLSAPEIHPTAIVHPGADLHPTVKVGAYAVIGGDVKIGAHTVVGHHAIIEGWTEIGERNQIFPGAAIGLESQDQKYTGERSRVIIGDDNRIREYVTINCANHEGQATRIGNNNLILAYAHIGHDCVIGDRVTITNAVSLGGHVQVESQARIGGMVGVHQFVHIGKLSMVGGMSRVERDVPPFMVVEGNPSRVRAINKVGLDRAEVPETEQQAIKEAFRLLYRQSLTLKDALDKLAMFESPYVQHLRQFLLGSISDHQRRGPIPIGE